MGGAVVAGLLSAQWADAEQLVVVESSARRRAELQGEYPGVRVVSELEGGAGLLLAVKPGDAPAACEAAAPLGFPRVLSVMAGVTLATLEAGLGTTSAVVRAMPNTPALVGAGMAAIAGGSTAGEGDLEWAESILGAVGRVVRVPESQLDAVTGLSGSGPAYVFVVAEALIDAGVLVGLPRPVAEELAIYTLLGSARLLAETGESPAALRAAVTSPGGTTAAGLRAMEERAVRAAFIDAVVASCERSRQLGS
jgi:pyrroline-5-carboxylate reductase